METEITITNLQKRIPLNPSQISRFVRKILNEKCRKNFNLSVVFVSDREIRLLNQKYLRRRHVTDVLAFNLSEKKSKSGKLCGEIVISTDTVLRNAKIFKTPQRRELFLCVVHGILHLTGFDDHSPKDMKRMHREEEKLLSYFYR